MDAVQDWVSASDLFVFLSRREGLGYVILEAMACGLPVIVSPLDGIADELVDEGETGFVIRDPDDPRGAAERIRELLPESPRRDAIRERARATALERFSLEARARRLAAIYRGLVR
jgi:mannosyltransferase